jgi:hypothetical protein
VGRNMKNNRKLFFTSVVIAIVSLTTTGCVVSYTDLIKNGKYHEAALQCEKQKSAMRRDCYLSIADASFARENYDTALRYYRKLDHLAGMAKVKEAYLAKVRESLDANDLDMAARYMMKYEEKIIFIDNFDDKKNEWAERKSKEANLSVANGSYNFVHKRNEGSWLSWQKNIEAHDPDKEFAIESTITKASGSNGHLYGIFFGVKDSDNGLYFEISGNGHYSFSKELENKVEIIIKNTVSSHIDTGNETNKLRIESSDNYLKFYINDHFVGKAPQERLLGNAIGFSVAGNIKIEFDNLILSQFPTEQDIYTDLAKKEAINGNEETAYQLLTKAGYTKEAAYIYLAEVKFDQEDYAACKAYIDRAGWSLENISRSVIFEDTFEDNTNKWFEKNNEDVHLEIVGGSYVFEKKKPEGVYSTWHQNSVEPQIDPSGDFKIESTITKEAGKNNNAYNTIWGMKDSHNYDAFGIAGDGAYIHFRFENNKLDYIMNWTNSELVHKEDATNVVSIIKSGNVLKFYINDRFVDTAPYHGLIGDKIGFSLNRDMRVKIDHIVLTQFPPDIVLAMAAKSFDTSGNKKGFQQIAEIFLAKKSYDKAWEYYGKALDGTDVAPAFLRALLEESKRVSSVDIAVDKLQQKGVISALKQILNHKTAKVNELAYDALLQLKAED